jgi:hypothetical protein
MERCPDLTSVFLIAHDKEVLESAPNAFDQVWAVEQDDLGSRIHLNQRLSMIQGR